MPWGTSNGVPNFTQPAQIVQSPTHLSVTMPPAVSWGRSLPSPGIARAGTHPALQPGQPLAPRGVPSRPAALQPALGGGGSRPPCTPRLAQPRRLVPRGDALARVAHRVAPRAPPPPQAPGIQRMPPPPHTQGSPHPRRPNALSPAQLRRVPRGALGRTAPRDARAYPAAPGCPATRSRGGQSEPEGVSFAGGEGRDSVHSCGIRSHRGKTKPR